jgi:hypothetical protein
MPTPPVRRLALAVLAALTLGACGAADKQNEPPAQVSYEHRLAFLTSHPYQFTCGDERHVNRFGKRTYFALADTEHFANMSRLRAATSIFYAVQEVCQGKTDAYQPIPQAVLDVRNGVYVSTQGNSGNDNDHGVNRIGAGGEPSQGTELVRAGT